MYARPTAFLVVLAGSTCPALADTIHVAPCGDDAWTGASAVCAGPNGPKRTIQAAINAAINGDTVLVADGTYTGPGNRDVSFAGKAITVRGNSDDPENCVIDCEGTQSERHRAFLFQSGETEASVLEGFTIRRGWAPFDDQSQKGGAVLCTFTSPVIRNCVFQQNTAAWGGAVMVWHGSITLSHCDFDGNIADLGAGGVWVEYATTGLIVDCTFANNRTNSPTTAGGGGLVVINGGNHAVSGCRFLGNTTARAGGGLWVNNTSATVTDCTLDGNTAVSAGGMVVSRNGIATVANCLFTGNRNSQEGSAAALWVGDGQGGPAYAAVVNCTFSQNISTPTNGAALRSLQTSTVSAANCIFWGNTPVEIVTDPGATLTLSYSDIQGGWTGPGTGNINEDRLFAGSGAHPFALGVGSRCIDAGDNTAVPRGITTDLAADPRFTDHAGTPDTGVGPAPVVDMGAYEYGYCYADCDTSTGGGVLDIFDFLCFQNRYSTASPYACDCDTSTGAGTCDIFDFLCFQNAFDAGCP